jgi:hypothetical protein
MSVILERAQKAPLPRAAAKYEGASLRLLVCLCRELQRESGEQPFFLSCRTAAELLPDCNHVKVSRWLALLRHDNVLHEVEKGDLRQGVAGNDRRDRGGEGAVLHPHGCSFESVVLPVERLGISARLLFVALRV